MDVEVDGHGSVMFAGVLAGRSELLRNCWDIQLIWRCFATGSPVTSLV